MSSAILKSFSWCGPSIERLCEADSEFAEYLINQTQEQRQCLVFVVLGWERSGSEKLTPKELAENIRRQSKKILLKKFCRPCPAGLVSVLKKLGNRIMVRDRYIELIDLLEEPKAAKLLWHEPKVGPSMILALMGLKPAFRKSSIVRNISNTMSLHSVQYAIAVARRASPKTSNSVLAKSLERKLTVAQKVKIEPFELQWKLQEWLSSRLKRTSIPAPPWGGSKKLCPITNSQGIHKTAADFENCLAGELAKVIGHKRYFYLWKDRSGAVVALDNEPLLGWIVGDIKGHQNKEVSKRTRQKIIEEFRTAGIEEYKGAQELCLYD